MESFRRNHRRQRSSRPRQPSRPRCFQQRPALRPAALQPSRRRRCCRPRRAYQPRSSPAARRWFHLRRPAASSPQLRSDLMTSAKVTSSNFSFKRVVCRGFRRKTAWPISKRGASLVRRARSRSHSGDYQTRRSALQAMTPSLRCAQTPCFVCDVKFHAQKRCIHERRLAEPVVSRREERARC